MRGVSHDYDRSRAPVWVSRHRTVAQIRLSVWPVPTYGVCRGGYPSAGDSVEHAGFLTLPRWRGCSADLQMHQLSQHICSHPKIHSLPDGRLHPSHTRNASMAPATLKEANRPIVIGNVAGAMEDNPDAMKRMLSEGPLDAIAGDWLSELNIAWNAIRKHDDSTKGYEVGFLEQLEDCIDLIAEKKVKCVTNAGALNTPECARKAVEICEKHGHGHLKVAYVEGDDISAMLTDEARHAELGDIVHLDHPERKLADWELKPYCGVAYIGAWGIVKALRSGADIIICGRVTDASPVIGLAAWWHDWPYDAWDELAGALVAGRE